MCISIGLLDGGWQSGWGIGPCCDGDGKVFKAEDGNY